MIQQGGQIQDTKSLNRDEYEKVLLHGAAKIMQLKTDRLDFTCDIDIDKLMQEGLERCRALQKEAEKQSQKLVKGEKNILDLTLQTMDCFKF